MNNPITAVPTEPVYAILTDILGDASNAFSALPPNFFQSMVELDQSLTPELGRYAVLVPDAALFSSGGIHTRELLQRNLIEAVIRLPVHQPTVFIINRQKAHDLVLFIDASYEDLTAAEQSKIAGAYRRLHTPAPAKAELSSPACYAADFEQLNAGILVEGLAFLASRNDIAEAGYSLNPKRFVDTDAPII